MNNDKNPNSNDHLKRGVEYVAVCNRLDRTFEFPTLSRIGIASPMPAIWMAEHKRRPARGFRPFCLTLYSVASRGRWIYILLRITLKGSG